MGIDFEVLRQKLRQGAAIAEPLKRRLWVLGVITEALKANGIRPILIGGCALEYYTARLPRQRPRAPLKEKLLLELDLARRDHLLACGELIRLGLRHWRWRITELESLAK